MTIYQQLERAGDIVIEAFRGKTDLAGKPYIGHIERVHASFSPCHIAARIVALLHDLLEDCPEWTEARLLADGFYPSIVRDVVALTRKKGQSYIDYIQGIATLERLRGCETYAIEVKLADLRDNMCVYRLSKFDEKDIQRLRKYHKAYRVLTGLETY